MNVNCAWEEVSIPTGGAWGIGASRWDLEIYEQVNCPVAKRERVLLGGRALFFPLVFLTPSFPAAGLFL